MTLPFILFFSAILSGCSIFQTPNTETPVFHAITHPPETMQEASLPPLFTLEAETSQGFSLVLHNPTRELIQSVQIQATTSVDHEASKCVYASNFPLLATTLHNGNRLILELSASEPINAQKIRLITCEQFTSAPSIFLECEQCQVITPTFESFSLRSFPLR